MSHRLAVVLAGGLVAAAVNAPPVSGVPLSAEARVNCGDVITADTTLHRDLVGCPNNGIVIGADGITLNLNGHRVDGDGSSFAGCSQGQFCDVGVLNDGHDGVIVRAGSVRDFAVGVFIGRARHNRVLGISSVRNRFVGIGVVESAKSVVRNSSGNRNGGGDGDGMFLLASHDVRVVHNTFRRNGELGLHIGDSNDNLAKGNLIERNQGIAVLIEGDRNQIRRNRIRHSIGNIIVAPGNGNVIANNRVSRSPRGTRSSGIAIEVGRGTMVNGNVIAHLRGPGISLGLENPPLGGTNNVIRRNLVKDTSGDGYAVAQKDDHSILRRNVAIGAKDDGFDIEGRRTKLTGNRAIRNGDLGIEAVRGVIDGGGNIARHNRDPRQCTHVPCN